MGPGSELGRVALVGVLLCVAAAVSGCALPGQVSQVDPVPTNIEPPDGDTVEVAIENLSSDTLAVTFSQRGRLGSSLIVRSCEASDYTDRIDGRFTVGLGPISELPERPMPPLLESTQLEKVDGRYRLLIRVAPNGEVTFRPLEGEAPRPGARC
jgi:hypothetical protein